MRHSLFHTSLTLRATKLVVSAITIKCAITFKCVLNIFDLLVTLWYSEWVYIKVVSFLKVNAEATVYIYYILQMLNIKR